MSQIRGSGQLDMHLFESIVHAQDFATDWLWKYSNERFKLCNWRSAPKTAAASSLTSTNNCFGEWGDFKKLQRRRGRFAISQASLH